MFRFADNGEAARRMLEQKIRQFDTDIARLFKLLSDTSEIPWQGQPTGGPLTVLNYQPLPALVRLTGDLYRGTNASAVLQEYDSGSDTWSDDATAATVTVRGSYVKGYFFSGDYCWVVMRDNDTNLYADAVQSGSYYVTGTITSALPATGSVSLTTDGSHNITVYGYFGDVDSGLRIGASWNDELRKWQAGDAECP